MLPACTEIFDSGTGRCVPWTEGLEFRVENSEFRLELPQTLACLVGSGGTNACRGKNAKIVVRDCCYSYAARYLE